MTFPCPTRAWPSMTKCECSRQCGPSSTCCPITQYGPISQPAPIWALGWITAVGCTISLSCLELHTTRCQPLAVSQPSRFHEHEGHGRLAYHIPSYFAHALRFTDLAAYLRQLHIDH